MPFFYKKSFHEHLARERLFTFTGCVAGYLPTAMLHLFTDFNQTNSNMKYGVTILLSLALSLAAGAQTVTGVWKTIDDETGEPKSHLELFEGDGKLYGKVVKLLKSAPDKRCDKCPGERYNQPILGMIVVVNMQKSDGYYQGGSILDPEKGKWYGCKMWLKEGDSNVLVVRGSIGPFYRTQYWYRQ